MLDHLWGLLDAETAETPHFLPVRELLEDWKHLLRYLLLSQMFTNCDQALKQWPFDLKKSIIHKSRQIVLHKQLATLFAKRIILLNKSLQQQQRSNLRILNLLRLLKQNLQDIIHQEVSILLRDQLLLAHGDQCFDTLLLDRLF